MMRAIQCSHFGELTFVELPDPVPAPGQLLIEVSAAGINYADTLRVNGTYGTPGELPFIPGGEVAGRTADGRRVVALTPGGGGGYASLAAVSTADAVTIPEGVDEAEALAMLVQGLTAWHLLRNSARLLEGESVVVNAAAGGVGSLAVQLAKRFGAGRVIAAASTMDKRELALRLGADAAIDSAPDGYVDRVRTANGGKPVDIILESTGGAAFAAALDALANFGRLVTYGNASREGRPLVDPEMLAERNIAVAGFWLRPVLALPGTYEAPLTELLNLAATGEIRPVIGAEYPLAQAHQAFEDLSARRTTGKLILRP